MQRVVRTTLVGLLTIAGLTACGDKVTVPAITTTPPGQVVHQVTVSPASASLNVGDKITLAASVNADAGVTNRTVTWSSSNTAIATVDANGVVTAVAAGNATVIAKSAADPSVQGAAAITVGGGQGGNGGQAVITISTVNTTNCAVGGICSSTPANLNNVTGQLDVTVNVDPGNQRLVGVDLLLNCGAGDVVVASQTLASAAQASAEASAAPVTLSFNTAAFTDSTGAVTYKNGACTIKARARTNATAGGAITTTTSTAQNIVLNNQDVVYGTLTSTKTAINPVTNLVWNGGDVTVRVVPLLFSGRTAGTLAVTFECRTVTVTGTGPKSVTFIDANDAQANPCTGAGTPNNTGATVNTAGATLQSLTGGTPAANDIDNITDPAAAATFTLVDAAGQAIVNPATCGVGTLCSQASVLVNVNAPVALGTIRLDTQRPAAGTFNLASNALQNTTAGGYIGGTFRFVADSAAGYVGPNAGTAIAAGNTCLGNNGANNTVVCNADLGGVDSVTVQFLSATSRTGTRTAVTNAGGLAESATNQTYNLIQITTDRLGNADTSYVVSNGSAQVPFASITTNSGVPLSARFGIDKTAPALTLTTGPSNQGSSQILGGTGSYAFTVRDTSVGTAAPSGPAPQVLLAQVRQASTTGTSTLPASGSIFTNGTENTGSNSGCVIGLFTRGSSAGGANALPVLDATGAVIGQCTPTLYTLAGGTTVPANVAGTPAYVTTRVIAVDQAGNQSTVFTNVVVEDNTPPTAGQIDAPQSVAGGSSVTFAARATDNLDVVGGIVQLNYPTAGMLLQYPMSAGPGAAFDNVLTTSGTVSPVVSVFYRNLQTSTAAQPTGQVSGNAPTQVNVASVDEVGRSGQTGLQTITLFTSFTQPSGSQAAGASTNVYSSNFNGGFSITNATNTTLSDCPAGGCANGASPANPTSTTFTATAAGVSGALTNPFTTVQFWYQVNGGGPWFFAGNATNSGVRDTGVGGQRFFDYTFTFTPPKRTDVDPATGGIPFDLTNGATLNVRAIGANSTGDGIVSSNTQTITLTNP